MSPSGVWIKVVLVDHQIAVPFNDRGGGESRHEEVAVVEVHDEATLGSQHAQYFAEDLLVGVVVEVAERGEPREHHVELRRPGQRSHVTLSVVHTDTASASVLLCQGQEEWCCVE